MREIKFRGKRVDNGEWHYGFYREFTMLSCWKREAYRNGVNYYIDAKGSNESYLVIPETVGQHTGLKDKNGKEIYENDILSDGVINYVVAFYAGAWCLKLGIEDGTWYSLYPVACQREVVGNIYENKDLLEG